MNWRARCRVVRNLAMLLIVTLLLGCGETAAPTTAAASPEKSLPQAASIDAALKLAAVFLKERQSSDGAWRSDAYAPFRDGDALTTIVVVALQSLPHDLQPKETIEHGLEYLRRFVGADGTIRPPRPGIAYPVYMAGGSLLALRERPDAESMRARAAWLAYLRDRQLTEQNGWQPEDIFYGGWGYAPEIPRKLQDISELSPLAEPNISATVFALEALRAAGVDASAEEIRKAKQFVERCQNVPAGGVEPTALDDGGFFFLQTDPFRNKAGIAGRDEQGRERYASYGSATADGLRALLLCGELPDSPRVQAAFKWLAENFSAEHQPGEFVVEAARDSVYFYYCRSLALLLDQFGPTAESHGIDRTRWADDLANALIERQRDDGSWINADVEVREDDPLVATSLATAALAACSRILSSGEGVDRATASP